MPGRKTAALVFILLAFIVSGTAGAEEKLGIKIYPGAKLDAETTKFLTESLNVKGTAYRTGDPIAKVIAFYKAQPDLKYVGGDTQSAMFKKGGTIDITVQSPWQNMVTGKMMKDTLISIVKNE
jgi:hypothetical protein